AINRHADAALAAKQLIKRHPGALGLDVPEGGIDSAKGVHEHRAIAPIGALIHRLPEILDVVRLLAAQKRIEVLLDGRSDGPDALSEGCATDTVKPRLTRLDLDDTKPNASRGRQDRLYFCDLQRRRRLKGTTRNRFVRGQCASAAHEASQGSALRSEERRVGKEWRTRGPTWHR